MIVVINSLGGLVSIQDEDLFQGSTKLNKIDLVAPFADNVIWKANFEMPDGTYEPEDLDGYLFTPSVKIVDNLNVWKLLVTFPITQDYGIVTMQLRGYIGDVIVCTTSIKLPIQKGVPYDSNFEELGDKDQILQLISDVRALINNKVDKVNYNYRKADYVDKDTVGIYYVYDYESNSYITKTLPQEYVDGIEYFEVANTSRITNNGDNLFLEYKSGETDESIRLEILKDKAIINGKQVVVFDDLIAKNISYVGTDAHDVQTALDKLKTGIEEANISSLVDLGDFTVASADWVSEDGVYKYYFRNDQFVNADTQSIIVTPDNVAINNLDKSDIKLYPEIDIVQESEGVAVGVVVANKQPTFDMTINVKLQGHRLSAIKTYPATNIGFSATDKINADNVQSAIESVQSNVDSIVVNNLSLGEVGGTAYAGNKGKANADQIAINKQDILSIRQDILYIKTGEIQVGTAGLSNDTRNVLGVSLRADSNAVFGNYTVPKLRTLWEGSFNSKADTDINLTSAIASGDLVEFLIQIGNATHKPLIVRVGGVGSVIKLSDLDISGGVIHLSQVEFTINSSMKLSFTGSSGSNITSSGVVSADSPNCSILKISKVLQ